MFGLHTLTAVCPNIEYIWSPGEQVSTEISVLLISSVQALYLLVVAKQFATQKNSNNINSLNFI
jgi:hypothetical protein